MQSALMPIMRDYLVRFQQTAIKETGRRPLTFLRTPMDEKLTLPGCKRAGFVFWQPIPWKDGIVPLGSHAAAFHPGIIDYLSLCQFLEIRFRLPVSPLNSPLSFLYNRVFETYKNTESSPPSRALEEALFCNRENPLLPLAFPMAATCDGGEPLLISLRAQDGQAFVLHGDGEKEPFHLKLTVDRLLPKLRFVYEF